MYGQVINLHLLFRIEWVSKAYPDSRSVSYGIITEEKFKNINKRSDSLSDLYPNVLYEITANGGSYLPVEHFNGESYFCCKFKDVELYYKTIYNRELTKTDSLEIVKYFDESLDSVLLNQSYYKWNYQTQNEEYSIYCWVVQADYCQCKGFMGASAQPTHNNTRAYLQSIMFVKKPGLRQRIMIKRIISKIVMRKK